MWIDAATGEIYGGDLRFGTNDFAAPNTPPPGASHAVLDEDGAFVAWADPPALPDWAGFRQWRRSNASYRDLLRAEPGLVMALENDIEQKDLISASLLWGELKNLGAISDILEIEISQALLNFNLNELAEALTNYNAS
jgi:hypothetical protein